MSIEQHTWEAIVTHARNLKPQVGTVKAMRYAMAAAQVGFTDEDAETWFKLGLERAINGPRPWPEFIPPVAVARLDAGVPAAVTKIPALNLPRPERAWCSEAYASQVRKLFVYTDRARLIRNAPATPPRDPWAPIPGSRARIVKRVSQTVQELADKVNQNRL